MKTFIAFLLLLVPSSASAATLVQFLSLFHIFVGLFLVVIFGVFAVGVVSYFSRLGTWPSHRDHAITILEWAVSLLLVLVFLLGVLEYFLAYTKTMLFITAVVLIIAAAIVITKYAAGGGGGEKKEEH